MLLALGFTGLRRRLLNDDGVLNQRNIVVFIIVTGAQLFGIRGQGGVVIKGAQAFQQLRIFLGLLLCRQLVEHTVQSFSARLTQLYSLLRHWAARGLHDLGQGIGHLGDRIQA